MSKRWAQRATRPPKLEDDIEELEGFVENGELYLRDLRGIVYSSERDDRGDLVSVGCWDSSARSIVRSTPTASSNDAELKAPATPASVPHPPVEPLRFDAAEEDHCETSPEAYAHIAGLLHAIACARGLKSEELRIYDPYFCNGAVKRHLAALGFPLVYNANEDFYAKQAMAHEPPPTHQF